MMAQQATENQRTQVDALKTVAQLKNAEAQTGRKLNLDALKHVADMNVERELRAMQERMRARQQSKRG